MRCFPIPDNCVSSRQALRDTTHLPVDVGKLLDPEMSKMLDDVKKHLVHLGLGHINVTPTRPLRMRHSFILHGDYVYMVKIEHNRSSTANYRKILTDMRDKIASLTAWCEANCCGEYMFDERGLTFHDDDDAVLYRLREPDYLPQRNIA